MQQPTPSRPNQRIERTQQSLTAALLELIVEQGYDRTTVDDILRRADVGRTAFYTHFENKQDLLLQRIDSIPWVRRADFPSGAITPGQLDATFLFGHIADQRQLIEALQGTPAFDEAINRLRERLLASFTQLLHEAPTKDGDGNLQLTAHALTGALVQLLLWWIAARMPEKPATMANWFADWSYQSLESAKGAGYRTSLYNSPV